MACHQVAAVIIDDQKLLISVTYRYHRQLPSLAKWLPQNRSALNNLR